MNNDIINHYESMKKTLPIFIVVLLLVGGGAFYGGMRYERSQSRAWARSGMQNIQNLSSEERQERMQNRGRAQRGARGENFIAGEILSSDAKSVTVKLADGGSKIVFLSDTTQMMKTTEAAMSDLAVGMQVTITGDANPDGSINAQSLQIRPKQ